MADRVVVDRIDFRQALVFPRVVGSVVGALQPSRMLLGTFALLCLIAIGRVHDAVRGPTVQPSGLLAPARTAIDATLTGDIARRVARENLPEDRRPAGTDTFGGRVDIESVRDALLARRGEVSGLEREAVERALDRLEPFRGKCAFDALQTAVAARFDALVLAVVTLEPRAASFALADLLLAIPSAMWREDWIFALLYLVTGGLAFGVLGAALSRMAALDLARRGALSAAQAIEFVRPRVANHALVPLWPGIAPLVLLPVAALLGFMGRVPGLDVAAGLLYPLALFFATLSAIVLLPWLLAMPMAVAASACEGCDGLEAAQRCGALVFRRPLHALLYAACAVVGVCLVAFVADLVVTVAIELAATFSGLTAGQGALSHAGGARLLMPDVAADMPVAADSLPGALRTGAVGLVRFWQGALQTLAAGATLAAILSASTAAYLALRRTCDDQPFDDLWMPGTPAGTRADA
jgi:hypothetical protein